MAQSLNKKSFSPRYHGQSKSMKKNIDNYIGSIVHDNEDAIMNGWYSSIADYIIHNAENGAGWYEYFDDSETEDNLGEPTQEQIDELEAYLEENYNYLPE